MMKGRNYTSDPFLKDRIAERTLTAIQRIAVSAVMTLKQRHTIKNGSPPLFALTRVAGVALLLPSSTTTAAAAASSSLFPISEIFLLITNKLQHVTSCYSAGLQEIRFDSLAVNGWLFCAKKGQPLFLPLTSNVDQRRNEQLASSFTICNF